MWKHVEVEMKIASTAKDTIGGAAIVDAICQSVVAMPVDHTHHLFQFDQNCSPEEATDKLPFVSVGSGQAIADPFLAFLKRIFWKDKKPSLVDGILAVLWTLKHAIEINPGGVADPKQIVVLEKKSGDWAARELTQEELQEHYEFIDGAENALANYVKESNTDTIEEIKIPEP